MNLLNYIDIEVLYLILFISILCLLSIILNCYYTYSREYAIQSTDTEVNDAIDLDQTEEFPPFQYSHNLFSKDECNQIIEYARPKLVRSMVDKGITNAIETIRTSSQVWIHRNELACLTRVSKYIAKMTDMPVENQEKWQLVHYLPGQEYKPHYDDMNPYGDYNEKKGILERNKKYGYGRRVFTVFIYLNEVKSGGETWFPRLKQGIKPVPGMGVLWHNLSKDRKKVHLLSEHGGSPVIEGEKWGINVWIREGAVNNG